MKKLHITLATATLLTGGRFILRRIRPQSDLRNKTVLVTGGSRGLGLLLAREFGRQGCQVAICARNVQGLNAARDQLHEWGVEGVFTYPCDVGNPDEVEELISALTLEFGTIDILVNNAGIIQTGPLNSLTLDDFQNAMQTMFWGHIYTTMQVLPQMLNRNSGHIVNITSIGGKVAVPHLLPYAAAKFAATGLSEGLTAELADTNVRVTTVIPGLMRTGSYLNAYFKGQHEDEFRWFGLSANLPLISMDAEHAARQIVQAVKRGQAEIILTLPAQLLVRFYGLFPGMTTRILAFVNRLILPPGSNPVRQRGMSIAEAMDAPLFHFLTGWGRSAASRFNQYRESDQVAREHIESRG